MTRYVCAWFPDWPLQRLFAVQPELKGCPVVLYTEVPRKGKCVVRSSLSAFRLGIRPGVPLADAQAILDRPSGRGRLRSHITRHDPLADREFLEGLAESCQRYSPLVGIDDFGAPDTLTLNITGCAEHFGGEAELADQMLQDFDQFLLRIGVADTIGAAWGVTRCGTMRPDRGGREIIPPGEHEQALADRPVSILRLSPQILESLEELGLRHVGQLLALPRTSLPSRFGAELILRLDQMRGTVPEILAPVRVEEAVIQDVSFEVPVSDRSLLEFALRQLLGQLLGTLAARQEGLQKLHLQMFCAGSEVSRVSLGSLRPSASLEHWQELLRLHLERLTLPAEVLRLQLEAIATARLEIHAPDLFGEGIRDVDGKLVELLDRLTSRLGEGSVLRPELREDAQPEFACRLVPVDGQALPTGLAEKLPREMSLARPLLLKRQPVPLSVISVIPNGEPQRFEWEGVMQIVERCWGPERIETGWWRGSRIDRDYYRVETGQHRRYWLFRDVTSGGWFLHGVFE